MRFGVMGPLVVWTADGQPVRVPESKVRALLADLLVHRGRPVSADRLVADLWGADPPGNPANTLQTKVSQLRRALGGPESVARRPAGYELRIGPGAVDAVDADRFADLTARARASDDVRVRAGLLADALALWRGPAFADFRDEEFARAAITRLEEARLTAVEDQAEARLELGEHTLLADELAEWVDLNPVRERLRAAQLRALYRAGRQEEALAGYAEFRERLADEMGLDPGPELAALQRAILAQDPSLGGGAAVAVVAAPVGSAGGSAVGAAVGAVARSRSNLPAALTELVGREEAVVEVDGLLRGGRLVTLTGPGGVGKTRLALACAERAVDDFPDGVRLVELAGRREPDGAEIADAIASALGIRDERAVGAGYRVSDSRARVADALRGRRVLLVLDNCEHVIEPVAEVVDQLLRAAPGLRILATSREPLAVAGEVLSVVRPLVVPAAGADPVALAGSAAVRLFVARAAAAAPGFVLDAHTADAVAAICRRLDGIPLALELAATRVRGLGVHGLAARLDDRFRVLGVGRRGAPVRQQTLRAMIDWSWELLCGAERVVLRRLAIHLDGCAPEAAEAVCAGAEVDRADVLDLVGRLVDRSLVVVVEGPAGPRYRLLESVAAYCVERLDAAGELVVVQERHDRHLAELVERAEPRLYGPEQREWLARLDAERVNLGNALESAVRRGDAGLALRLAGGAAWYRFLRGRYREARQALAAALAVAGAGVGDAVRAAAGAWEAGFAMLTGEGGDPLGRSRDAVAAHAGIAEGRARAEWFLGLAHLHVGDADTGGELTERALAGFRAADDAWGIAAALAGRAKWAMFRGDPVAAGEAAADSAARFAGLGERWGRVQASDMLAYVAEVSGEYDRAAALHREGLRGAEELGLWTDVSYRLSGLGRIALLRGDFARAAEFHERGRRLAVEQSDRFAEEFAEVGLGLGARRAGDLAAAERHLRNALEWNRRLRADYGVPYYGVTLLLAELGFVAELRGDAVAARAVHEEGLAAARASGDPRAVALALEGLAGVEAISGRASGAATLLGRAEALRVAVGAPLPVGERGDVLRIAGVARAVLGPEAYDAAHAAGVASPPPTHAAG